MTPLFRSRRAAATGVASLLAAAALLLAGCGGSAGAVAEVSGPSGHDHGAAASVSGAQSGPYAGVNLPTPYQRPSFTLTDTSGQPYDFKAQTAGEPTLLFFGYTNCPDVCPTTMADVAVALRSVGPALAKQVHVVFVTTDPKRDTGPVLAQWLGRFDADLPTKFIGLTGDQQALDQAQLSAGVPVAQEDGQLHSALLLLYGHDDKAHVAFDSGDSPQDIAHDLKLVAGAS